MTSKFHEEGLDDLDAPIIQITLQDLEKEFNDVRAHDQLLDEAAAAAADTEERPPLPTRPKPSTSISSSFSPHVQQFAGASEEAILKARVGLVDLSEKGREGFQKASGSVLGFLRGSQGNEPSGQKTPSPVNRDRKPDLGNVRRDASIDGASTLSRESSTSSKRSAFKWQVPELNRQSIERQISEQFTTVKNASQSAVSNLTNAANPLFNSAKEGINTATRNTSDFWEASKAKVITDKMNDDLSDYARSKKGTEGLCSKCRGFSFETNDVATGKNSDVDIEFETPLERILYHSHWCRLCRFFLQELSKPHNDAFTHPQIAEHLQPHLQGKHFKEWAEEGPYHGDSYWPFGYGKERYDGAFNYLDPVQVSQMYQRNTVVLTKRLVRAMTRTAILAESRRPYQSPNARSRARSRDLERLKSTSRKEYNQQTGSGNLLHPLECFLKIKIRTNTDPSHSGQVQASLMGYGRGFGAQLSTLVQFALRIRAEPYADIVHGALRYGCMLDQGQIDSAMSARWLHDCETNHGSRCSEQSWSSSIQAPPSLRVVDVQNYCVVDVPNLHDVRFVALSYVWGHTEIETLRLGKSNIDELSSKNGLKELAQWVPQTIKDAIDVVRVAGERYLWIDALCIIQDADDEEKHSQIKAMDWIYGKAIFTIIAADASNSMVGLKGVRPDSRDLKQTAVKTSSGIYLLSPIQVPQDLDSTIWNSRAWTFQERLLSRRLLIFQDGQMLWHCRTLTAHEDMLASDTGFNNHSLPWLSLRKQRLGNDGKIDGSIMIFPDTTTHIVRSETFKQYAQLVEQYTHRQLTNDADVLDALGGLLHIFRQFFKFPMRYGLPEILLDVALLWQPTEKLKPRILDNDSKSVFPSWSWAGWKGKVKYEEPFYAGIDKILGTLQRIPLTEDEDRRQERIRPLLRWYIKNKKKNESKGLQALNESGWGIPLLSKTADVPEEWEKDPFYSLPITERPSLSLQTSDLPETTLNVLQNHHLVFRTSCVSSFRLGTQTHSEDIGPTTSNPPIRYNILNSELKNVGTVLMDGDGPHHLGERHEFIVISEAEFYGLEIEPGPGFDSDGEGYQKYPLFNVMLVEWDCDVPDGVVARRVGLGRVDKKEWRSAGGRDGIVCLA